MAFHSSFLKLEVTWARRVYATSHRIDLYTYGIFNRLTNLRLSPWPTVVVQSLLTAWVVRCFTSAFFSLSEVSQLLSLAFFLTVGTSLPWFCGSAYAGY